MICQGCFELICECVTLEEWRKRQVERISHDVSGGGMIVDLFKVDMMLSDVPKMFELCGLSMFHIRLRGAYSHCNAIGCHEMNGPIRSRDQFFFCEDHYVKGVILAELIVAAYDIVEPSNPCRDVI